MSIKRWLQIQKSAVSSKLRKMVMKCICSDEHFKVEEEEEERIPSSESLATRDYSASGFSSRAGDAEQKANDSNNIEEAESSLRESGFLNYEEARALLGRLEYQKGNIEGALHVFEGIDIAAVIPRIKMTLVRRSEVTRRHSQSENAPPMSMHAVSLLIEAIFLKAKSLQTLARYKDAAQSCKVILDTFESALPEGLPDNFVSESKLIETLNGAVELLPELWKLDSSPQDAILAYRRALLYQWNLDTETRTKIEKDFAVFLLYSGNDACPPTLRFQMDGSFVPRNNVEEAILLLLLILKKFLLNRVKWDPSILDHLSFALPIAGNCSSLAREIEQLPPGVLERREMYSSLALCYHAEGEDESALNLLRNFLINRENHNCAFELLLASKICSEDSNFLDEGIEYVKKSLDGLGKCKLRAGFASYVLGRSLSAQSRGFGSDSQRLSRQSRALEELESAKRMTEEKNADVLYALSLEYADQRKLDNATYYAKKLLELTAGSGVKGWILLGRILSAQKRYYDAESVIDAALDESGKWEQGELLRTKAKLQIAQSRLGDGIETYTKLLAVLQVQRKSLGAQRQIFKNKITYSSTLEMETWHDLAKVYAGQAQWRDAEICISKSDAISPNSASRYYCKGLICEAKGEEKEALRCFKDALDLEPDHVPSLISTAIILKQLGEQSLPIVKGFLTHALKLDSTNAAAWYHLGLLYMGDVGPSGQEAAECFKAAALLEEFEPVEPFR